MSPSNVGEREARPVKGITPAISVVIPTYNRVKILEKALAAFQTQSIPQNQFEVIIVDDGSTDDTGKLVTLLAKSQPNIHYFRQDHGGPAKARNLGIKKASASIILFTNDDCIPHPQLLDIHLYYHASKPNIALLGYVDWHPDLTITPFMRYVLMGTQFNYPEAEKRSADAGFVHFYTSNISIRKKLLINIGLFDESFPDAIFEDLELGYRASKAGIAIIFSKEALTYHYHPMSLKDHLSRRLKIGKYAVAFYRKHPELADALGIHAVVSAESRYRYYDAIMHYYQLLGMQQELKDGACDPDEFIPLQDRLKNWASIEQYDLAAKLMLQEKETANRNTQIDTLRNEIDGRNKEIARLHQELAGVHAHANNIQRELDKTLGTVGELNRKNMEKYYRIVELEKFELRVKSTFFYQIYRFLKKLFSRKLST